MKKYTLRQKINLLIYAENPYASGWSCIIYLILLTSFSDLGFYANDIPAGVKTNYDSLAPRHIFAGLFPKTPKWKR